MIVCTEAASETFNDKQMGEGSVDIQLQHIEITNAVSDKGLHPKYLT